MCIRDSNWVPDLFMKRLEAREDWTLFCSSDAPDLHETYGRDFEERYLAYEAKAECGEMSGEKTVLYTHLTLPTKRDGYILFVASLPNK